MGSNLKQRPSPGSFSVVMPTFGKKWYRSLAICETQSHGGTPCTCALQWNPSNPDTTGLEESVLIREVSLFQGLKSTQTHGTWGGRMCPV